MVIFNDHRKTGFLDLEAIEMAVRSAMHQAGAAALSKLLQFPVPVAGQRMIPCSCGPAGKLPGGALQADSDGSGGSGSIAPLLLVFALPSRPVPRR